MSQLVKSESLRGYSEVVRALGGEPVELLEQFGLSESLISEDGNMLPYRSFVGVLEETARALGAPDFGLRLAMEQDFSVLGPIALAAQQGTNLGEALKRVSDYLHVYTPALGLQVNSMPCGTRLLVTIDILLDPLPPCVQATELTLGLSAKIIKMLSGGRCVPLQVLLPHSKQHKSRLLTQVFTYDTVFNQGVSGFIVKMEDLMLPIYTDKSELGEMAYSYLQSQFIAKQITLTEKVAALIKPMVQVNQCTNEAVAAALVMPERQLHRMLEKEGENFRSIKDRVLKELAEHYLKQESLKLGQIARLLGYAEQSAFSRSCQRWFQMGPRDYRKSIT